MLCGANRNKQNITDHSRGKHIGKSSLRWLLFFAVLMLMPAAASAAGSKVSSQEELLIALEAGETAITLTADLVTDTSIFLPVGTVVDLDGYSWTVEKGTVASAQDAIVGGSFTSSKNGTIRQLTTLALEYAVAGEPTKSVTYADGENDDAAGYIAGNSVAGNGTVSLYLKKGKSVSRVTTAQSVYRLGNADAARLSLVYSINYNLDGGRLDGSTNPTEYTAADAPITLLNPTKEGYTFLGWTGTGLSEPTMTVTIPMQSTGSRSYTALWEEAEQEETPAAPGGTGGSPSGGGSFGGGFSANISGSADSAEPEETEEASAEETATAATPAEAPQQNNRRISVASSSVETEFRGARPVMQTVSAEVPPRIHRTKLFIGAGLLLAATIGAGVLLWQRRE